MASSTLKEGRKKREQSVELELLEEIKELK